METISAKYLEMQRELHKNKNYGIASLSFARYVAEIYKEIKARTISDYGAGKKRLLTALNALGVYPSHYYPYDPVFPEYGPARSADIVCCIDVLEHIELDKLDATLQHLQSIITNIAFISIHMGPAGKFLSDGRNAHLIQKPSSWWLPKLSNYMEIIHLESHELMGKGIWFIAKPINLQIDS